MKKNLFFLSVLLISILLISQAHANSSDRRKEGIDTKMMRLSYSGELTVSIFLLEGTPIPKKSHFPFPCEIIENEYGGYNVYFSIPLSLESETLFLVRPIERGWSRIAATHTNTTFRFAKKTLSKDAGFKISDSTGQAKSPHFGLFKMVVGEELLNLIFKNSQYLKVKELLKVDSKINRMFYASLFDFDHLIATSNREEKWSSNGFFRSYSDINKELVLSGTDSESRPVVVVLSFDMKIDET